MKKELEELRSKVENHEERIKELESLFDKEEVPRPSKDLSLPEFINDLSLPHHTDKALAVGYFLESEKGKENFSSDEILKGYRDCKIPPPGNVFDVLARLKSKGLLMEDGEDQGKTQWVLTRTGEEKIREKLGEESS